MKSPEIDWPSIRDRASEFSESAFDFVRDGLKHTVQSLQDATASQSNAQASVAGTDERRHVSGQQLCLGLKDLAIQRWGLLAQTVLKRWGIVQTNDFGTIVYAMIDRAELKSSARDSIDDFKSVYDFDEAFGAFTL